ncbi:MAG: exosortase C-terminal domain/associated protein EpsI [Terriglobales bacterium]
MPEGGHSFAWRAGWLAALLFTAALGLNVALRQAPLHPAAPLRQFPLRVGIWKGTAMPLSAKTLAALDLHDYLNRVYFGPGEQVAGFYVAYYPRQTFGDDIHSPKNCLPGSGWEPIENGVLALDLPGGRVSVNRYLVARGSQRELILYWFQQQGRVVRSEYWSKLYQIWDGLRQGRSDAALVRVAVPIRDSRAAAVATGTAFIRDVLPRLQGFVPN